MPWRPKRNAPSSPMSAATRSGTSGPAPASVSRRAWRRTVSARIAASQRSGTSARAGSGAPRDSMASAPAVMCDMASSARRRAQGIVASRSCAWLSTLACNASAQTTTSERAGAPSSSARARASSVTVRARAAIAASRPAHCPGERGLLLTAVATASSASFRRCRVIERARWLPVAARTDSRTSSAASPIPASAAGPSTGPAIMSRHACPSAIRWPARLPLSTDDTYFGSSGRQSFVSYQL